MKVFKFTHSLIITAALLVSMQSALAQTKNPSHRILSYTVKAYDSVHIDLKAPVSSFSIEYKDNAPISSVKVYVGRQTYSLHPCKDCEENGKHMSNLVIFKKPVYHFNLYSTQNVGGVKLHLLYAQPVKLNLNRQLYKTDSSSTCTMPANVDQDKWRAGLPAPKGTPESAGKVEHVIVHHTDTPNSDSDYVNVVRNIYLYHTQSNGWDDIGYNYLISADGVIFAGRDGRGIFPDDNTKGAHFCNKNSNTMGIAMLGTFDSIAPTDTAMKSLRRLAAWKLVKEGIMSTGTFKHPVGDPSAIDLKVLAGHRDGCSTDCPGQMLYARLNTLRKQTDSVEVQCGVVLAGLSQTQVQQVFHVYPQPATNELYVTGLDKNCCFRILSLTGQQVSKGIMVANLNQPIDIANLKAGLYILELNTAQGSERKMIVKN